MSTITAVSTKLSAAELTKLSPAELQAMVLKLQAQPSRTLGIKRSEKGAVSVYGLSARFPVTLYAAQWEALAAHLPKVLDFIKADPTLPRK